MLRVWATSGKELVCLPVEEWEDVARARELYYRGLNN